MPARWHRLTSPVLLAALLVVSPPVRALACGLPMCGTFFDQHAAWHAEEDADDEFDTDGGRGECWRDHPPDPAATPEPTDRQAPDAPVHLRGCAQLTFCPTTSSVALGPVTERDDLPPPAGPHRPPAHAAPLIRPPRA
jgi:hypothetical protein